MMLKVIQITDCHVSADPGAIYRGINPRQSLEQLLIHVREWGPDLLVVTGDLAEDASDDAYAYLAEALTQLRVPVLTLPGNHDYPQRQQEYFQQTATTQPLAYSNGNWQVILLNTAVSGKVHGAVPAVYLSKLRELMSANGKHRLIFIHHQPVKVGSPWIDRHALDDPDPFLSCLDSAQNIRAVLWGHIHQEYSDARNGVQLLGTPSTSANSLPRCEKFTIDGKGPACRWLKLDPGGVLDTGILSVEVPVVE